MIWRKEYKIISFIYPGFSSLDLSACRDSIHFWLLVESRVTWLSFQVRVQYFLYEKYFSMDYTPYQIIMAFIVAFVAFWMYILKSEGLDETL
ncbi:hypothetical protein Avbf_01117 [Armadillidium vulgare]|nr:hypothetical protein Avbf_01117 [Armadillidium vulgare]